MSSISFCAQAQSKKYRVIVGRNLLTNPTEYIEDRTSRVFIVTDEVVSGIHLDAFVEKMNQLNIEIITQIIRNGEQSKTLETVENLYDFLITNKATRSDTIIALGGGVVGDIVGFVSATFKRGMELIQIPTTLLAQVDSSLGGKNGVNLPSGKNLVGTFYQPTMIVADVNVLSTLPEKEFRSGIAEVVKYGVIMDSELFEYLERFQERIISRDHDTLEFIVERCLRNKAEVVYADEREENGIREILNFGHTIGHALEIQSEYKISHGEAVSIGMVEEASLSVKIKQQDLDRIVSLLSNFNLPNELPINLDKQKITDLLKQDKKIRGGKLLAPLLVEIGKTEMREVEYSFFTAEREEILC